MVLETGIRTLARKSVLSVLEKDGCLITGGRRRGSGVLEGFEEFVRRLAGCLSAGGLC